MSENVEEADLEASEYEIGDQITPPRSGVWEIVGTDEFEADGAVFVLEQMRTRKGKVWAEEEGEDEVGKPPRIYLTPEQVVAHDRSW